MIVSVRRWTSIALPRIARRAQSSRQELPKAEHNQAKPIRFFEAYNNMLEHQVGLMFKDSQSD